LPKTKNKTNTKTKKVRGKVNVFRVIAKIFSVIIAICLIAIPLAICLVLYVNYPVQSVNSGIDLSEIEGVSLSEDGGYYIDVKKGESSQSVGRRLERAGLIKNRHYWNILCRLEKDTIKTGTYKIELPANQPGILRQLIEGKQILHSVTIPEGVTIRKIASILEEAGICSNNDFLSAAKDMEIINDYNIPNATMEGYLFPDTYLFPKEYPAKSVIRKMADNFYERIENISPSVKNMSSKELNDIVILASIVEREYRRSEEAPLMSGVFLNRLRINMALQSCATVVYIMTEIQNKPHPSVLLFRDLEVVNPYNTYMYPGLPPGPICAPGNVALHAVIFPESTNYLYFRLTDPASGKHYFSRTHDEHINAGQLLIKP